jgi:hypothetical protein
MFNRTAGRTHLSMSKRFLFGKEPLPESMKAERERNLERLCSTLTVRIPTRRKNRLFGRRWDPLWPSCLAGAARELGIEVLRINDVLLVSSEEDAERIVARAQSLWQSKSARISRRSETVES